MVNAGNTMAGKYLRQTADIDMTGVPDWTPIAKATTSGSSRNPFSGTYDGRGHRIKNFVYNNAETSYFGLFGVLGESSVVKSIVLDESCSITAKSYVGGIAARSFGRIEDCVNYGKVTATGTAGQVPTLMVYPRRHARDQRQRGSDLFEERYHRKRSEQLRARGIQAGGPPGTVLHQQPRGG